MQGWNSSELAAAVAVLADTSVGSAIVGAVASTIVWIVTTALHRLAAERDRPYEVWSQKCADMVDAQADYMIDALVSACGLPEASELGVGHLQQDDFIIRRASMLTAPHHIRDTLDDAARWALLSFRLHRLASSSGPGPHTQRVEDGLAELMFLAHVCEWRVHDGLAIARDMAASDSLASPRRIRKHERRWLWREIRQWGIRAIAPHVRRALHADPTRASAAYKDPCIVRVSRGGDPADIDLAALRDGQTLDKYLAAARSAGSLPSCAGTGVDPDGLSAFRRGPAPRCPH